MPAPSESGQQIDALARELAEIREQQAAIRDVLSIMSNSPGDVTPVFHTVAEHAARICEAQVVDILVIKDGVLVYAANFGEFRRMQIGETAPLNRDTVMGRSILDKRPVSVTDLQSPDHDFTLGREYAFRFGHRTTMAVPLLREDRALGVILIRRGEVRPFEDKHIGLLKTFADQASIAIDNARLLNELRLRTGDLSESLEQQTAISDILHIISTSPGDVRPVFDSVASHAARICEAPFADIIVVDGDLIRVGAKVGGLGGLDPGQAIALDRTTFMGRSICDKQTLHVADLQSPDLDFPLGRVLAVRAGARTALAVPLIREGRALGTILVRRTEVRLFDEKHITLLKTFADQAAIAIENARLLNELRRRTDELSEALDRQSAISDVLREISNSPGDVKPVLDAVARHSASICAAPFVDILIVEGETLRNHASYGALGLASAGNIYPLDRSTVMGRAVLNKAPVHVADLWSEDHEFPRGRDIARQFGHRTTFSVPLVHEDRALGVILVRHTEVRPFDDKHISLLKTFADQAAIAIENARLLNEVRQQASQLEAQSAELRTLNQQLEGRVAEQVGEIERIGRLRRFLSPQVADLIVSSGGEKQLESHRREITALFCDLRGFTGFSESSDPEDVMLLLREYHKAIGEIVFRHGGTLERFSGDGIMVIFGAPVPLPNPPLAAVQMALELRVAITALVERWRRLGHELGFGIGISHGFATLGTIGFEGRFDYAAIGMVSNVAARLCDQAKPGQILVSPRALMAIENAVAVEVTGEMTLKGIRRPLLVHNVVGLAEASG